LIHPSGDANASDSRNKLGIRSSSRCPTALAPMQDVTGLAFMKLIAERGEPDLFFTEFFRVHANSKLCPEILSSITKNPTECPVFAQIIGENIDDINRTVTELICYPIAGVDLNMGCPAPRVYKKNVGGGLLKDPKKINQILHAMRSRIDGNLTVKMRIGFEDDKNFEEILNVILANKVNLLSLHVRTVRGGYNTSPQYAYVEKAVQYLGDECPVLANGSIETAQDAVLLREKFDSLGVMIGRAAIRNPWIFRQIREIDDGQTPFIPRRADLHAYCLQLYDVLSRPGIEERKMVSRMKKFLNYIGLAIHDDGVFLGEMRRAVTKSELFAIFDRHLSGEVFAEHPLDQQPLKLDRKINHPEQGCCHV